MLGTLEPGDRLLVSELSRLGRSLSQVIQIVETLVRRKIRFIAIKEAIEFDGKQDLRTKVMIALFGLFAEVERDLISERTKEGLAAAKAKGKRLGRPKGALEHPGSTASSKTSGRCWARMSPRPLSPRYWTSPAPPSTTSSRPARSLRADPKARTALMLYFNTNVGATLSGTRSIVRASCPPHRTLSKYGPVLKASDPVAVAVYIRPLSGLYKEGGTVPAKGIFQLDPLQACSALPRSQGSSPEKDSRPGPF